MIFLQVNMHFTSLLVKMTLRILQSFKNQKVDSALQRLTSHAIYFKLCETFRFYRKRPEGNNFFISEFVRVPKESLKSSVVLFSKRYTKINFQNTNVKCMLIIKLFKMRKTSYLNIALNVLKFYY